MGKEVQPRSVSLRDYAAAVAVANAPVWMLNTYRDMIATQVSLLFQLLILGLTTLAGGALAGFLIARKTGQTYQKAGVTTGALSYITYAALSFILGFGKLQIQFEDYVVIPGFVVGAAIGAKYWASRQRPTEDSKEANPT